MIADIVRRVLDIGARIGAHPGDSEDVRLRKSMLVMSTVMFIGAGLLWVLMYFALGEISAGWIPFGYGLVSPKLTRSQPSRCSCSLSSISARFLASCSSCCLRLSVNATPCWP